MNAESSSSTITNSAIFPSAESESLPSTSYTNHQLQQQHLPSTSYHASSNADASSSRHPLELSHQPAPTSRPIKTRTGYVYDHRMSRHRETIEDDVPHPEKPERITVTFEKLWERGLITRMKKLAVREVTKKEILTIHSEELWNKVQLLLTVNAEEIVATRDWYHNLSLYISPDTGLAAQLSAGGVIETALAVMDPLSDIRNAFALVRPPGHHAEPHEHMGFCFFNNVAVATGVLQERYPGKKIAIVDWDVHHGNGTQKAFYRSPDILYISLHRYDGGEFYPSGPAGSMEMTGEAPGEGMNVNIPFDGYDQATMGDAEYLYAFQKLVLPICYEFAPDLIFVSAGFDAAQGDPLGDYQITPSGYAHMLHLLSGLAQGKIVVALEGGYNVDSICVSALACTQVLLGDPLPQLAPMTANLSATDTVYKVAKGISRFWSSVDPVGCEPRSAYAEVEDEIVSLSDIIKMHRLQRLSTHWNMFPLPITDPSLETLFAEKVLVTENVMDADLDTLVLFVHDLGTLKTQHTGPKDCDVNTELSYILDISGNILQWVFSDDPSTSLGRGKPCGIVDVVFPDTFPSQPGALGEARSTQGGGIKLRRDLMTYIWDNVCNLSGAEHIVLIAHGLGCEALMSLVNARDVSRMDCIVQVHGMDLLVRVEPEKQSWMSERSLRIVPAQHPIHAAPIPKRHLKGYGELLTSDDPHPNLMLLNHLPQIQTFVQKSIRSLPLLLDDLHVA